MISIANTTNAIDNIISTYKSASFGNHISLMGGPNNNISMKNNVMLFHIGWLIMYRNVCILESDRQYVSLRSSLGAVLTDDVLDMDDRVPIDRRLFRVIIVARRLSSSRPLLLEFGTPTIGARRGFSSSSCIDSCV